MIETITRVPPSNNEAEQAVLASCLLDRYALSKVADQLVADDFYHRQHGVLFAVMVGLLRAGKPVDLITAQAALGSRLPDAGGQDYLVKLVGGIPTTSHADYYAGLVKDCSTRRAYIEICANALNEMYDPDSQEAGLRLANKVLGLQATGGKAQTATLPEVVAAERLRIDAQVERRFAGDTSEVRAFTTGIYSVDRVLAVDHGDMVLLGARPSAGKTALGLQISGHVAEGGKRVLFYSKEMSKQALARRWLTQQTAISAHRQLTGDIDTHEMDQLSVAEQYARDWLDLLEIDDRSSLTVAQMHAGLVQAQRRRPEPIGLIVIDHLVKVKSSLRAGATKHEQMSQISGDVKQMAKDTGIPVLALMQLRRPKPGHEKDEPDSSDLRESGSLEEDADVILMIHRPDRQGVLTNARLLMPKQRNGPVANFDLLYDAQRTTFRQMPSAGAL